MPRRVEYWIALHNAKISVPRREFFIALRHYNGSTRLREMYEEAEQHHDEIHLMLPTIGLMKYQEDMYVSGRAIAGATCEEHDDVLARANGKLASTSPRPLIINPKGKDHLND